MQVARRRRRKEGTMSGRSERAEAVRKLVREARHGLLSTLGLEPAGFPYGSLVQAGSTKAGEPVIFVSRLSQHTKNLMKDPRVSLVVLAPGGDDPMQAARATLIGPIRRLEGEAGAETRQRFLQTHPEAESFFELDFALWAIKPDEARYVGGFGAAAWVSGSELVDA
jgi:putative heme iron utilization protein